MNNVQYLLPENFQVENISHLEITATRLQKDQRENDFSYLSKVMISYGEIGARRKPNYQYPRNVIAAKGSKNFLFMGYPEEVYFYYEVGQTNDEYLLVPSNRVDISERNIHPLDKPIANYIVNLSSVGETLNELMIDSNIYVSPERQHLSTFSYTFRPLDAKLMGIKRNSYDRAFKSELIYTGQNNRGVHVKMDGIYYLFDDHAEAETLELVKSRVKVSVKRRDIKVIDLGSGAFAPEDLIISFQDELLSALYN